MDKQDSENRTCELTTEDLDAVHGGVKNAETPIYRAFVLGIIKGTGTRSRTPQGGTIEP